MISAAASSTASNFRVLSSEETLSTLVAGTIDPIVLVSRNDHLYLLLGAIEVDGELMCQILHGNSAVSLVARTHLLEAGMKEAWKLENAASAVPLRIGNSSELTANALLHNFGEVQPDEELHCRFQFTNTGHSTVILDKPRTSCRCTTTDLTNATELQPGRTKDLEVIMQATASPSMRESVLLTITEKGSDISRQQELILVASQRQLMTVTPRGLDFGTVTPDVTYDRTVRLSEVVADRFVIERIEADDVPITHEVEEVKHADGLRTYRIRLRLNVVDGSCSGKQVGKLNVSTNSRLRPLVTIPIEFAVAPRVRAEPSVVSFGAGTVGQTYHERVRIISTNGKPAKVKSVVGAYDCSVTIDNQSNPPELVLTATPSTSGVWRSIVEARVETDSVEELIQIEFVGVVN